MAGGRSPLLSSPVDCGGVGKINDPSVPQCSPVLHHHDPLVSSLLLACHQDHIAQLNIDNIINTLASPHITSRHITLG